MGDPAPGQSGVKHTALIALLVCAGYYVGAELAFMLRIPSTRSSIIWAPNAVLLAALLLTPPRTWAIWFLAALPAHLVAQSRDGGSVLVLLYPFFANVAQVIVAAIGLRCFAAAPPRFNTLRDMTLFVLIAAITAPALISFLAAWLFVSVGWETDFWLVSRGRFLNNMTTGLTVAPLILMVAENGLAGLRRRKLQRHGEFALLAVGLVGTLYATHTWTTPGAESIPVQLYAPLPFLLWAAVRFGPGGLCLFLLVVAAHSISETISGRGPYVAQTPAENVLALQISLAVLATPLMFVAALIGERLKKEEGLQRSEERFRRVLETAPDGMVLVRPDGTIALANEQMGKLFGYGREELVGQGIEMLALEGFRAEQAQQRRNDFGDSRVRPRGAGLELYGRRKDGSKVPVEIRLSPLETQEGVLVCAAIRDITERKRAEEALWASGAALRKSHDELQELAGKLLTAQEEERRRLARELHDDLTQRLAVVAIEAGKVEQQLQGGAEPVLEGLRRMKQEMIELSAVVHGISRQLHPSILDDLGLVNAIEAECMNFFQREGIQVTFRAKDVPAALPRDVAVCLYRILQGGLRNIAKHANTKKADVTLTTQDGSILLLVRDHGIGFDPAGLRGKPGLGLASMEERVRLIRGRLSIQSEPGKGTSIEVWAPVAGGG